MSQTELSLAPYRPAEIWRLTQPMYSQPEPLFRDTLMYLFSCSALKLILVRENPDPAVAHKLTFPYVAKGPEFDKIEARSYERVILEPMTEFSDKVLLRNFVLDFSRGHNLEDFKKVLNESLKKNGLVHGMNLFGFPNKTRLGKNVASLADDLIQQGKEIGRKMQEKKPVNPGYLKDLFAKMGHHLLLLEDFPFKKIRELGGSFQDVIGFEAGFFDEEKPDFPDLNVLVNLKSLDNVILSALKKGSESNFTNDGLFRGGLNFKNY
ncbi:MAG: hypothetical protein H6581_07270 [Bacteroidia bacterium]|nr:hypothetical protein [Bacteroidia bacterium]